MKKTIIFITISSLVIFTSSAISGEKQQNNVYEKHFKQSDIDKMHGHGHDMKSEHNSEDAWNQWVKSMKNEMESGASPQSAKVKKLMEHWDEMVMHLSGGDEKRQNAFNELMHNEPQARRDHGIDDALFEFMSKASKGH